MNEYLKKCYMNGVNCFESNTEFNYDDDYDNYDYDCDDYDNYNCDGSESIGASKQPEAPVIRRKLTQEEIAEMKRKEDFRKAINSIDFMSLKFPIKANSI